MDLAAIASVLQKTTGLIFPPSRRRSAEAGMRRAMDQLGLNAFDLWRAIAAPGGARDALVTEITTGETFFFREPEQIDFVRDSVLPVLRDRIGGTRPLRMWSAGSATGEEAYSLAMVLREVAWPWPAAILGTDLVPARLAAARRGRYTQWSMRGVPEAIIDRYFERQDKHFVLREDIRRAVDFRVLNLAADAYPSSRSGVVDMDVIFCRNVLIYLDRPNVAAIARGLLASLAPDGWLFLGASDPAIADIVPCEVVVTGAGVAYRRLPANVVASQYDLSPVSDMTGAAYGRVERSDEITGTVRADEAERVLATTGVSEQAHGTYEDAYRGGEYDRAASAARQAIERGGASERAWTVLIRSLANEGNLDAAGEAAAAALDHHRMSAEVSYLNGVLLSQSGRRGESAAAFRRALYLDSRFAIAHLALGDELFAVGDEDGARRAYANAESLLCDSSPDAAVSGADGLPANRLLHIARYHLQRLPDGRAHSQRSEAM
jgi:chemotaxis protein methyltransferase CheR